MRIRNPQVKLYAKIKQNKQVIENDFDNEISKTM